MSGVSGFVIYVFASTNNWTAPTAPAPWFAPAVSSLLVLTGIQLMASWFLGRVLADLTTRSVKAERDLNGEDSHAVMLYVPSLEKSQLSAEVAGE